MQLAPLENPPQPTLVDDAAGDTIDAAVDAGGDAGGPPAPAAKPQAEELQRQGRQLQLLF